MQQPIRLMLHNVPSSHAPSEFRSRSGGNRRCSRNLIRSPGRGAAGASPNGDTGVGEQSPLQRKRGFAQENGFLHEIRNILLKNAGTLA
jgi:hypothetical protein